MPIDEVLRLLTRSRQQGSVDVSGGGLSGRIFVGKGGIDLATIWDDENLHRHLVNSGAADVDSLRRITARETTLAAISESNKDIVDLVREVTVESIYQMDHRGNTFEVREGASTPYASPKSFELESLIEDSRDRQKAWDKVREHVPDLTGPVSFRRDLGEREEVTVRADAWKVLSEIGSGASVQEIADQLGTTEFWAARVASRLLQDDLIDLRAATTSEPVPETREIEAGYSDYTEQVEVTEETQEQVASADSDETLEDEQDPVLGEVEAKSVDVEEEAVVEVETAVEEEAPYVEAASAPIDADDAPHDESWWQEPEDEAEETDDEPKTPEVVGEGLSEIPTAEDDQDDVEEDTEAFLEKVFSELESSEPEAEEGHGLLRRRRMGSLRDFSSDS